MDEVTRDLLEAVGYYMTHRLNTLDATTQRRIAADTSEGGTVGLLCRATPSDGLQADLVMVAPDGKTQTIQTEVFRPGFH